MKLISSSLVPCRPHFEADCFVTPLSQLDENRLICGKKEKKTGLAESLKERGC